MRAMGSQMARRAAAVLDLEGVDRILDVGGGWGHFSKALCERRPGLRATVLDIPEVAELAAADLAASELGDRIDFLPGDYLETDYGSETTTWCSLPTSSTRRPPTVRRRWCGAAPRPWRRTAALSSSISPSTMRSASTC